VYVDGAVRQTNTDILVGNEEDSQTIYPYDLAGRISSAQTTFLDSNNTEEYFFSYQNGLPDSITGRL